MFSHKSVQSGRIFFVPFFDGILFLFPKIENFMNEHVLRVTLCNSFVANFRVISL